LEFGGPDSASAVVIPLFGTGEIDDVDRKIPMIKGQLSVTIFLALESGLIVK
jgi:hypothetical protein